jgi:hypothetical protein
VLEAARDRIAFTQQRRAWSPARNDGSPAVLTGEGAYEGLSAVMFPVDGPCLFDFRGLVIEIPDPPVPYTGD